MLKNDGISVWKDRSPFEFTWINLKKDLQEVPENIEDF